MRTKIIKMLRKIQDSKDSLGSPDWNFIRAGGEFNDADINLASSFGFIAWTGVDFYVTEKGFQHLITYEHLDALNNLNKAIKNMDEASSKLNGEVLTHTKIMTKLTKWLFGFTIANLFLIIVQIVLQFRGGN